MLFISDLNDELKRAAAFDVFVVVIVCIDYKHRVLRNSHLLLSLTAHKCKLYKTELDH